MHSLLAALFFIFIFIKNGFALRCYECSNLRNDNGCQEEVKICETTEVNPFCIKAETNLNNKKILIKTCGGFLTKKAQDICETSSTEIFKGMKMNRMCGCTSDLCNKANVEFTTKPLIFSLIFVSVIIQLI